MNDFQLTTDWLRARSEATPQEIALIIAHRAWTFASLDGLVTRLCGILQTAGVEPETHVAVALPNSLAALCHVFALARLGAVLVPLNVRLTAAELAWQVGRSDCNILVCSPSTEATVNLTAASARVLVVPDEPDAFEQRMSTAPVYSPMKIAGGADLDRLQAIVFTSGTTGYAKGAMLTFRNQLWSAVSSAFKLGLSPGDRWLACLPWFHVGGLAIFIRSCLYGTAVVLNSGFDVTAVMRSLAAQRVSLVSLVPTMLHRLLHEGFDASHAPALRMALLGGAALSPTLEAEALGAGIPVAVSYGLTEAASQVATRLSAESPGKSGCAGRALLFTRVAILDENGRVLGPKLPGEIAVFGPTVMSGYYNEPEATAAVLREGWLRTGDMGYLDEDGDLWVLDRRSDLIVTGGENVYPAEVERVLRAHPAVALACVVGLPDEVWGQRVTAMVVLRDGSAATEAELLAHCRQHLAGYKQPRSLLFTSELPQTGSGKIIRRSVADQLAATLEAK